MPTPLSAFIHLSFDDAKAQWEQVIGRPDPGASSKKRLYLPVEVLFCFGLSEFGVLDAHRFGGGTAARAPAEVQELARTFKRTPDSILLKMFNLDGLRSNGAKYERELFKLLSDRPDLFLNAYRVALDAAREVGLTPAAVPDLSGGLVSRLELRADQPSVDAAPGSVSPTSLPREVSVRLGQQLFRQKLMRRWGRRCAVTGCDVELFLRASHIRPWSRSSDAERLDPNNGLLLMAGYDAAFDVHYISFDHRGRLLAKPEMSPTLAQHLGIALSSRLRAPPTPEMRIYLEEHWATPAGE